MMLISTMFLYNTQLVSRETDRRQYSNMKDQVARELALTGRKLILASWVESGGTRSAAPFAEIERDGGTISVSGYDLDSDVLDFTVRASYQGAVHEVRSKYRWNTYAVNPLQIKATDIHLTVSPWANLDIASITLDDQSIEELNEVLINELQLGNDLSDFNLSLEQMQQELETKLGESGNGDIDIQIIDQAARDLYDQQNGLFFPDQVQQAINTFMADNPSAVQQLNMPNAIADNAMLNNPEKEIYTVDQSLELTHDFSGKGILIIDGSLIVPDGVSFDWEGLVIVRPPVSDLHAQIDLQGNVTLDGSLIALQEAIPNSGHMDVTIFRDTDGAWGTPYGSEQLIRGWSWCTYHTHDFTGLRGNMVRFYANSGGDRIHENDVKFNNTFNRIGKSEEYFLAIKNEAAHGRGILSLEVDGQDRTSYPVAPGFDPTYVSEGNPFRSTVFTGNDLNWLEVDIRRLSSLKKLWDDSENPFPGCTQDGGTSGPPCVGQDYNRQGALTFQLFHKDGFTDKLVYEASLYWHRREDEEEEFEQEMDDLVSELQSTDTGLTVNFGDNVNFTTNPNAIAKLGAFGGLPLGVTHLGTWHTMVESE
ncbi:MAG: hypothetical protein R2834_10830 [Rhodothermales bacterium]